MEIDFYRGKRVFLTGHTGFKGMWLALLLLRAGAEVTGFALDAPTQGGRKALERLGVLKEMRDVRGDVRDLSALSRAFDEARPEVVFHLAAQPIVRESYVRGECNGHGQPARMRPYIEYRTRCPRRDDGQGL